MKTWNRGASGWGRKRAELCSCGDLCTMMGSGSGDSTKQSESKMASAKLLLIELIKFPPVMLDFTCSMCTQAQMGPESCFSPSLAKTLRKLKRFSYLLLESR